MAASYRTDQFKNGKDSDFRYMVSTQLTTAANYKANSGKGVIAIHPDKTATTSAVAAYAIVSHGAIAGCSAPGGNAIVNCSTTSGAVYNLPFNKGTPGITTVATTSSNYFDDVLVYSASNLADCSGTVSWGNCSATIDAGSALPVGQTITKTINTAQNTGNATISCALVGGTPTLQVGAHQCDCNAGQPLSWGMGSNKCSATTTNKLNSIAINGATTDEALTSSNGTTGTATARCVDGALTVVSGSDSCGSGNCVIPRIRSDIPQMSLLITYPQRFNCSPYNSALEAYCPGSDLNYPNITIQHGILGNPGTPDYYEYGLGVKYTFPVKYNLPMGDYYTNQNNSCIAKEFEIFIDVADISKISYVKIPNITSDSLLHISVNGTPLISGPYDNSTCWNGTSNDYPSLTDTPPTGKNYCYYENNAVARNYSAGVPLVNIAGSTTLHTDPRGPQYGTILTPRPTVDRSGGCSLNARWQMSDAPHGGFTNYNPNYYPSVGIPMKPIDIKPMLRSGRNSLKITLISSNVSMSAGLTIDAPPACSP